LNNFAVRQSLVIAFLLAKVRDGGLLYGDEKN